MMTKRFILALGKATTFKDGLQHLNMLREDEELLGSGGTYSNSLVREISLDHDYIARIPAYENDDLDDVFGSAPGSPSLEHDIRDFSGANPDISDVPRLKEKHETEGYRDGVTRGKAESVQAGFDEGYGLGAVIGLRVGKIRGLIEGIIGAVSAAERNKEGQDAVVAKEWMVERSRLEKLWQEAKTELKTESIFAREWWGEDGIWTFEVPGEGWDENEVVFTDIASAHPLIRKWERVIKAEVERWSLDIALMGYTENSQNLDEPAKKGAALERTGRGATQDLAW